MKENSDDVIGIQDEEEEINSGEQWKKTPYLKINSMDYNQNNTLLVLSTNYGYRIFDVLNDFKLVSVVDENQKELGPLKKTKILYKSSLLGFIGMRENERFKENTFNFYSDEYKKLLVDVIGKPDLPIVFNINIGHAMPRCIMPFGVNAIVDAEKQIIRFSY